MLKAYMEDEVASNINNFDKKEAKDKMMSLEKVKSMRLKHMARNKKAIDVNEICQLSDEMSSDGDSIADSVNSTNQEESNQEGQQPEEMKNVE